MIAETLSLRTPEEVRHALAQRLKGLRLKMGWKQDTLAGRSGISLGSLKRFETLGEISLARLLKLAHALGCLDEFYQLMQQTPIKSMAELEREVSRSFPKRGRT